LKTAADLLAKKDNILNIKKNKKLDKKLTKKEY